MRISRLVLSDAAIGTIIGTGHADFRLGMCRMRAEVTHGSSGAPGQSAFAAAL
jgi:hypothetical protein